MVRHTNNSFLAIIITALLVGLTKFPDNNIDICTLLFALFYVGLRLKTFMDDYAYFRDADYKSKNFKIGFCLAIISWLIWAFSGFLIYQTESLVSLFLLGLSLSVSTSWIIADGLRAGATKEQYYWIIMNAAYVTVLWSIQGFRDDLQFWGKLALLILLMALLIIDFIISNSFVHIESKD